MDKASAEVETLEREKAEKDAKEEEKRNTRWLRLLLCLMVFQCCETNVAWKSNYLATGTSSTSSVKQRGGKKNGKRHSSEDRTAEEEEVREIKAKPNWIFLEVEEKSNLISGERNRIGRASRLVGILWLLPLPWYCTKILDFNYKKLSLFVFQILNSFHQVQLFLDPGSPFKSIIRFS